jgi:hypothetical protein
MEKTMSRTADVLTGAAAGAALLLPVVLLAAGPSLPHTFVNGTLADADQVNANQAALAAAVPTVVSTTKTDRWSHNTTSWAAIDGYAVTITPKTTDNQVLVTLSLSVSNTDNNDTVAFRLTRNGTPIALGDADPARANISPVTFTIRPPDVYHTHMVTFSYLDTPGTTGAVTYGLETRKTFSYPGTIRVNQSGRDDNEDYNVFPVSTITAMEVFPSQ